MVLWPSTFKVLTFTSTFARSSRSKAATRLTQCSKVSAVTFLRTIALAARQSAARLSQAQSVDAALQTVAVDDDDGDDAATHLLVDDRRSLAGVTSPNEAIISGLNWKTLPDKDSCNTLPQAPPPAPVIPLLDTAATLKFEIQMACSMQPYLASEADKYEKP